jgi:hypothetical protein
MSNRIESWFDKYQLVVVPVDPTEVPITRWRTDVISTDIENTEYHTAMDRKVFSFRYGLTVVRIKDLQPRNW